ncbi:MAG: type II secretion system F family protein [Clostridium sp.]|nr:type II secretion system F family protein [Clostridium sp.]MCM1208851.1 type II secretion system F family protein [Ruminococcus sp.]
MAQYNYKVMDKNGKPKKGTVEAVNEEKAKEKLKSEGFIVQEIKEQGTDKKKKGGKVKDQDLAVFCKQFGAVLNAGVTMISALEMMGDQIENKALQRAIREAQAYVQKGGSLADAFRLNPKVFPPIFVNMVAAGELSGSLETSFDRLTTHFENANKLKSKVKGAMTYPIVILIVVIAVVVVLLVGVVPTFADMFEDLGSELPKPTQMLVSFSGFLQHHGIVLALVIAAIVFALVQWGKTPTGAQLYSSIAIKAPLFGNLTVKSAAATFARTLSTLMGSGVPLMDAIEQVARMQNNKIIREGLLDAKTQVAKGVPLSKPIRDMEIFPPMLSQMTKIGEETGNIEDMMDKVADYYEMEVNNATDALTAMMEPLIIVVMGVTVGGIVLAIYSPMLSMYDAIDNY